MEKQHSEKLIDILPKGLDVKIIGDTDISISSMTIDSRLVVQGSLYAALRGTVVDGHSYIAKAIANGAKVIVCEQTDLIDDEVTYLVTPNVRNFLGHLLNAYYGVDFDKAKLIGVTGTNGKTSVTTILFQLYTALGYRCGLVSTVENRIGMEIIPTTHTTPDIVNLHKLIAKMSDEGCKYIFMEVSSHAVDQERIAGLRFTGAVFTNLSHDHLDYHGTMLNYINAKKKFFDNLSKDAFAIINVDDANGSVMTQNTDAKIITYGIRKMADYKVKIIESSILGLHLRINEAEVHCRMVGGFNAYNIAAVYGVAKLLGQPSDEVLAILSGLKGAEGRFEQLRSYSNGKYGIVDYAHTPDALENVCDTIIKIKSPKSRLIVVVGCGGDRDKSKRPIMASIATKYGNQVILTSDNPRTENPDQILDDMERGLDELAISKSLRITDRFTAIKTAVLMANDNDIILVAGKGHEKYQDINGKKFPFDDKKILADLLG